MSVTVQRYVPLQGPARDRVSALAERVLVPWWPVLRYQNERILVRPERIAAIVQEPDVVWVGVWKPPVRLDEVQDQIVAGQLDAQGTATSGPGYLGWLLGRGVNPDPAAQPIVVVADDGIGDGTVGTGDPTLHLEGSLANATRVAFNTDCTGNGAHGPDGHGHLNTNIVGGYDTRAGEPFQDGAGFARGLGVNPFVRLGGLRIFNDAGNFAVSRCGNSDLGVIAKAFQSGARISSNSWGASSQGDYDDTAQTYDVGTRDAVASQNGTQQLLFVFAAGNDGPGGSTVGTPGTAKNVVTVGASENVRPDGVDGCLVGPADADNGTDIIDFSSRGLVEGGRVKPDVVAPGTHVQGTASTDPRYTGVGVCDKFWPAGQTVFARSSGTSHSTPAVAGALSLYRSWLPSHLGIGNPTPALLKAYLIAHTTYLTGHGAGDTLPSDAQGYGMPNLALGLDDSKRILVNQTQTLDASGATWNTEGAVADPNRPVKVVLAWTDAPGSLAGAPQVNDLDLQLTLNGVTYLGNHFSGPYSIPGGVADSVNNVEVVSLPPGQSGVVEIQVLGRNIAGDGVPSQGDATDQDFALVGYNVSNEPSFRFSLDRSSAGVCRPGLLDVPVDVTPISGYTAPVTLGVEGLPEGVSASFAPPVVSPPGTSHLLFDVGEGAQVGSYPLRLVGTSGALTQDAGLALGVEGKLYEPALNLPVDQASAANPSPTMSWFSVLGAASYRVQVATDPTFSAPVFDQDTAGTSLLVPALLTATTYFWRVQSNNSCGPGPISAARRFTTATISTISASAAGLPVAIPDNDPVGVVLNLDVPENFVVQNVTLDVKITHTWRGDLQLELTSPKGTKVRLKRTNFNDSAHDVTGNYDLTLTPDGPGSMSDFDGQNGGGTWTLFVSDLFLDDVGHIEVAKLNVTGFVEQSGQPVPELGWLAGLLATVLLGRWVQSSTRRRVRVRLR